MKPIVHTVIVCASAAVAAAMFNVFPARGGEQGQPAVPTSFVVPLEITPTWREALPMLGDTIVQRSRNGAPSTRIDVRLQLTHYRYEVVRVREGRVLRGSSKAKCYELVSDAAYTWANFMAPPWPAAGFALFTLDDGTSYLCWASAHLVQLADVTWPRDRIVAFHEYFAHRGPPGPPPAKIGDLVPGGMEWGGPLLQFPDAVRILALTRGVEGGLVLTVKDTASPAAAVLGLRDGEWTLLHNYPDGLPEPMSADPSQMGGTEK